MDGLFKTQGITYIGYSARNIQSNLLKMKNGTHVTLKTQVYMKSK